MLQQSEPAAPIKNFSPKEVMPGENHEKTPKEVMPGENHEETLLEGWMSEYRAAAATFRRQYADAHAAYQQAEEVYKRLLRAPRPTLPEPAEVNIPDRAQKGLERLEWPLDLLSQYANAKNALDSYHRSVAAAAGASSSPVNAIRAQAQQDVHDAAVGEEERALRSRLAELEQILRGAALAHLDPYH